MQNATTLRIDERLEVRSREPIVQAFEQSLSDSLPSFHKRAYRILGNVADAEDAVQDALLAAYIHLDQFKGQSQISTWLTAIVLNCARMQLRLRARRVNVCIDEPMGENHALSLAERLAVGRPTPEDECRNSELNGYLTRFQAQLSPTLRRTFQLRDVEGLSIRETAQILRIPSGTVKARSARARKRIIELMGRAMRPRSRRSSKRVLGVESSSAHGLF